MASWHGFGQAGSPGFLTLNHWLLTLACSPQIVGFLICMGIAAMAILGLVVPKGNAVQAGWTAVDNVSSYVQKVRRA